LYYREASERGPAPLLALGVRGKETFWSVGVQLHREVQPRSSLDEGHCLKRYSAEMQLIAGCIAQEYNQRRERSGKTAIMLLQSNRGEPAGSGFPIDSAEKPSWYFVISIE
jgi:hypothetical protein